jgi:hypothetical protein
LSARAKRNADHPANLEDAGDEGPPAQYNTQEAIAVRPHSGRDQHSSTVRWTGGDEWTTFTVDLARWPLFLRLRGSHPLVRAVDRIEAAVLTAAVALALIALPIAGAVGTAVYGAPAAGYDSAPVGAVAAGLLVWAGVIATATAGFMVTHGLCNRSRRARWESGLDTLADHGGGPARQQP